ncbi:ABC transporter C family member 3 [Platanthera guangdongensis]|uniref:ABC transporter C family member 3 n=1 Tax=Platanthera guangdongensis TaxID=2320717 RepID=A0ABR2M756_9ASPA
MAIIALDMFTGRERFSTLLMMRLIETVILWLSEDQTFWEDMEEGLRPFGKILCLAIGGTIRGNLDPLEEHTDYAVWQGLDKCQHGEVIRQKAQKMESRGNIRWLCMTGGSFCYKQAIGGIFMWKSCLMM